jgi:hypothetical protein
MWSRHILDDEGEYDELAWEQSAEVSFRGGKWVSGVPTLDRSRPSLINPVSGVYPRGMHMQAEVSPRRQRVDRREIIEESPDNDILSRLSDVDRLLPDPGNRSTLTQRSTH